MVGTPSSGVNEHSSEKQMNMADFSRILHIKNEVFFCDGLLGSNFISVQHRMILSNGGAF